MCQQILVPTNGGSASGRALQEVARKTAENTLAMAVETVRKSGVKVAGVLRDKPANLIVIGPCGRKGLHRLLLGSVAEGVTREATVPVLLIREQA